MSCIEFKKYNHHYILFLFSFKTFILSCLKIEQKKLRTYKQISNVEYLPLFVLSYTAEIIFGSYKNCLINFRLTCIKFKKASLIPNILKVLKLEPLFLHIEFLTQYRI